MMRNRWTGWKDCAVVNWGRDWVGVESVVFKTRMKKREND